MSVYERTVKAFIQVIENQSNLLSLEDWSDLQKLASNLPENPEELSNIIRDWLKQEGRSNIQNAFNEYRKKIPSNFSFSEKKLGIRRTTSPTPANQPSPSSKELLDNAIKNNSPLSDKQKPQQQP